MSFFYDMVLARDTLDSAMQGGRGAKGLVEDIDYAIAKLTSASRKLNDIHPTEIAELRAEQLKRGRP